MFWSGVVERRKLNPLIGSYAEYLHIVEVSPSMILFSTSDNYVYVTECGNGKVFRRYGKWRELGYDLLGGVEIFQLVEFH